LRSDPFVSDEKPRVRRDKGSFFVYMNSRDELLPDLCGKKISTSLGQLRFSVSSQDRDRHHVKRLLLLSGPIAGGKTSVSASLQERHGFVPISSGSFLRAQLAAQNEPIDRRNLQELGDSLDRATDFSWLIESVASPAIEARPDAHNWLLDAVRKPQQVALFRLRFGDVVRHVHIFAPESVLEQRCAARGLSHLEDYQASVLHPNEQSARSLAGFADKVLDTKQYTPLEIADQIMNIWET